MGRVAGIERPTRRARTLRNAATPAERSLWAKLGNRRLDGFKFSRQMPVGPYVCDFMCRSVRLIVELDGVSHDMSVEQDAARTRLIKDQGFTLIRFSNADVLSNVEGVCRAILHALKSPPPTPPASGRGGE